MIEYCQVWARNGFPKERILRLSTFGHRNTNVLNYTTTSHMNTDLILTNGIEKMAIRNNINDIIERRYSSHCFRYETTAEMAN